MNKSKQNDNTSRRKRRYANITYEVLDTKTGRRLIGLNNYYEIADAINTCFFSGFPIISYQTARQLKNHKYKSRPCYKRLIINSIDNNKLVQKDLIPTKELCSS
jgi:hypothetical protein|tara:strand:- start:4480 stop:4791 length:312 start_codon:yes stop_codon:yes gene_type:complete